MAEKKQNSLYKYNDNRYDKVIDLARAFDAWRLFPRIFITIYIVLLYQVVHWFMGLTDPNIAQSGLVSVVTGAGAAWFGLYVGGSNKNQQAVDRDTSD